MTQTEQFTRFGHCRGETVLAGVKYRVGLTPFIPGPAGPHNHDQALFELIHPVVELAILFLYVR
ncbi:hypothetical protein [Geobacter sp.]|uniref:hypothetical protein n=1 Tax=Geobacter sp. TaxID=46610 RepID=UPI002635BA61|nr:hypothetical protein [Geobacter sp.]